MKIDPGPLHIKDSKFSEKKESIFTFSIFLGFGCPGVDFMSRTLIFWREHVLAISCLVDCIEFFSVLECPKSMFGSFPIIYDISAFISRADRRNRSGGFRET